MNSKKMEKHQEISSSTADGVNTLAPETKEDPTDENVHDNSVEIMEETAEDPNNTPTRSLVVVTSSMKRKGWRRYIGIMLALFGSVMTSLGSIIVKILTKEDAEYHYNPVTVAVWRFQGIFLPSVIVLAYLVIIRKEDVLAAFRSTGHHWKWKILSLLSFRSACGMAAVVMKYYAIFYMNAADASVISLSTPVFVTIIAFLFLGESCGFVPVFSAILTLCGVGIISRPPFLTGEKKFHKDIVTGVAFAFSSMMCLTLVFVMLRKLKAVHYAVITAFFGFTSSVVCLILTTIVHPFEFPRSEKHWLIVIGLGLLTYIGQSSVTLALKFEEAGPIALVRTSDSIFTFIWQILLVGMYPDVFSYCGASIVVTGIFISGLRKWASGLPEGHATRRRLSFLLH